MLTAKRTALAAAVLIAGLGTSTAYASANNNFTMLDGSGGLVGGTNDVSFTWDGSLNTSFQDNGAGTNATLASANSTPFFGQSWTAYNVTLYGPGTYTISTADTSGSADCPFLLTTCASAGNYTVTVGAGQIGAHMKFAWGTTEGIDVLNVWQPGDWTALNPTDAIWTGAGGTYTGPVYDFVSTDWNGDNNAGAGMIDGPFAGFNANFSVNQDVAPVPVPAAVWLFGSGLLGLVGIARRKKKA